MGRIRILHHTLLAVCLLAATQGCLSVGSRRETQELNRILKSGNEALLAGKYDDAIRQFDIGLALSPRNPTFLTSKSIALRSRGVARYNAAIQLGDEAARAAGKEAAKRDISDAASVATESLGRLKSIPVWETMGEFGSYESNTLAALAARADALRLLASRFEKARADEALSAAHEYLAAEHDKAKRLKARADAGQMLLDAGRGEQAAAEYREVLAEDPNNLGATLGMGLALSQSGDTAKYREAAVYLQRYVERAPDGDPLKASAKETLEFMNQKGDLRQGR